MKLRRDSTSLIKTTYMCIINVYYLIETTSGAVTCA